MIQTNSIAFSLFTTIASDSVLVNSGFTVSLGEPPVGDLARSPWVSVLFQEIDLNPYRFGNEPWLIHPKFQLIVQHGSYNNPQDALDKALRALEPVLDAVNSNKTLDNTVNILKEWTVENLETTEVDEDSFHSLGINLTYELFG